MNKERRNLGAAALAASVRQPCPIRPFDERKHKLYRRDNRGNICSALLRLYFKRTDEIDCQVQYDGFRTEALEGNSSPFFGGRLGAGS